jgi:hypothetical protein
MTVKLMAALVRHRKAVGELTTTRSGQRCVVRVEVNEEMGRSSGEGWMRCRMLRGSSGRVL